VERCLGFRPRFSAFDAAFDAFYVCEYFYSDNHDSFAAVPFTERGGYKRRFDAQGWPLCQASFPMPLKYTFWFKTALFPHQRGRHGCPINHKQWTKGGCTMTMPTSMGASLRYQLDRQSKIYQ
jgi:hypothetical protein